MKSDQNFDSHSATFGKNIYGTSKGKIRQAVLMRDLLEYLEGKTALKILDVGGGQGQIALQLAQLGHQVTITDISKEMLEVAQVNAQAQGLTNVSFVHCPLQELEGQLSSSYDLVLCHAVFEWLEDPRQALAILKHCCNHQGAISLMFFNFTGQVLSNLIYGNFEYLHNGMQAKKVVKLNPQSALEPEHVYQWAEQLQLTTLIKSGIRCFHDYMRDIKMWQEKYPDILDMELKYSRVEPYISVARYIHLMLKK